MREIKRSFDPRGYFGDDKINDEVYGEIHEAFERLKDREIEKVLTQDHIVLDDAVEEVAAILDDCHRSQMLFASWIYEGKIPEELMDEIEEEADEDSDDTEEVSESAEDETNE